MKIPGYSHWLTVFRPLSWLVPLAEQAYDVAGVFLAADKPIVCTGRCISAAERDAIRALLDDGHGSGKNVGQRAEESSGASSFGCPTSPSQTSAPRRLLHSPKPEDAAGGPPPIAPDTVSGGGHPHIEDPFRRAAELARLQRELDAARQERDNANARANATRLAP